MSIAVEVENDAIKLPLHVPDGTKVEIVLHQADVPITGAGKGSFAKRYAKYVGMADALPEDFAVNHKHYLHGAPTDELRA